MSKESPWWTDVGRELYSQQDQAKARRLLQEAGYQGQPMRYMTTKAGLFYKLAVATKPQLEAVGFNVDLQVVESATLAEYWDNPDLWDAFPVFWFTSLDEPTMYYPIRCDEWGWNCDPDFEKLLHAMATELQFEKRYRLWQAIQELFWERVPVIHYGRMSGLSVMRQHVHGPFDMSFPNFWNVWVGK